MTLKLVINDSYQDLLQACTQLCLDKGITLEPFNEDVYKDKKKAIALKYHWGTRLTPFAVIEDEKACKAFYSDTKECTYENIRQYWGC